MRNKILVKHSFFNRYVMISGISLSLILTFSWFFESDLVNLLFNFEENYFFPPGLKEEFQREYLLNILTWETFISSAMFHLVLVFPLFPTLFTLPFLQEKHSYFILGRNKFRSLKMEYYKSILKYAVISSSWIIFVFVLFISIGGLFLTNALDNIGGLTAAFPDGFYNEYPYFVFLFMVIFIYGAFSFVFSLLASGLMLWLDKGYLVVFTILIFYQVYSAIGNQSGNMFFSIIETVVAYNTNFTISQLFFPLILILLLALALIFWGVNRNSRGYQL